MFEQLLAIMQELEEQDELFKAGARVMKKTYDALIEAGFTPDQATLIVAHQGAGIKADA